MDRNNSQSTQQQRGRPVSGLDAAHANEYFEQFLAASSLKHILGYYRGLIDNLHLKPNVLPLFYPKLRANLTSWKAKALWKKFDARAAHKCYMKGKAAPNTRVLIIGGGPCGMRAAIEAQLLGAKVVVVEKRDRFSRNNVLHLWPFVIEDLRMLGAKKFFGKFCAGAIDHISIRRLQCILLKVALLLGVEVHTEVSFEKLVEPNATEKTGWRAEVKPADHPVSQYEFDVIIGADGKRNTLQGFTRKEFRGKLAIAITANFINKKTEAEARVEEISGVAFIFNQKFFKDLLQETRIDLENIVYYKDDTHYFVMTAKKASLLEKGVIKQDLADTEKLLAPDNVDRAALEDYAIEAASFSTNYQMSNLEFAVNHYGQPDIAMFDFTSMFAADNASKVVERNGYRLLMILVGDSLLEPFWPTGSGCARGFLSSLDAAWAIRSWSLGNFTPLEVLAERESIYRLLAQTTPDNLNKDWKSYTLDPSTRYPNLNKAVISAHQTVSLYDTDNPASIERMKRNALERPTEVPKKRRRGNVDNEVLLNWLTDQLRDHDDIAITDIGSIFKDGRILCAIIHHYRPDLLDYGAIKDDDPIGNNQLAFDTLEKELGIPPIMTGEEITNTEDYLTMASYLTQVYDTFRGEIPHIKQPKLKLPSKIPKSLLLVPAKSSSIAPHKLHQSKTKHTKIENKSSKIEKIKKKLLEKISGEIKGKNSPSHSKTDQIQTDVMFMRKAEKKAKKSVADKRVEELMKGKDEKLSKKSSKEVKKKSRHEKKGEESPRLDNQNSKLDVAECTATEGSTEDLIVVKPRKSHTTKIAHKRKHKQEGFSKEIEAKVSPRSVKKKIRAKKSKLSVIPEAKVEQPEEIYTEKPPPPPISDLATFVTTSNCMQAKKEATEIQKVKSGTVKLATTNVVDVFTCNAIYDNKCFQENSERTYRDMGSQSGVSHTTRTCDFKTTLQPSTYTSDEVPSEDASVKIRMVERKARNRFTYQQIEFSGSQNQLTICSKTCVAKAKNGCAGDVKASNTRQRRSSTKAGGCDRLKNVKCQKISVKSRKRKSNPVRKKMTMSEGDGLPDQIYNRVSNWISTHDFQVKDELKGGDGEADTVVSNHSDMTSVTRATKKKGEYDDVVVEERTDVVKCRECESPGSSEENFSEMMKNLNQTKSVRTISKFSQYSPFQGGGNLKSVSAPPTQFSVIVEGEESELPESNKRSELSFKSIKTANMQPIVTIQPSRPSSRHKRHADAMIPSKPPSIDRKIRKRRTLEKVGASVEERQKMLEEIASNRSDRHNKRRQQRKLQTEQFLKSMQMLQANARDPEPFEDYSIFLYRQTAPKFEDRVKDLEKQFTYVPDHDGKLPNLASRGGGTDEDLAARIKSLENKWRDPQPVDKKPKDLLRAIGKIETSDWNIKEIEKKIMENKLGKPSKAYDKEKVPKWSKEQFLARQTKMEKQHLDRQDSAEAKFADIDKSIKNLDQKLKEGTVRELGQNKVATITERLVSKVPPEPKPVEKTNVRPPVLPAQSASEFCHFCGKRVYLMERLSAEGRFFHHGCFKCQYCNTQLRLGSYAFDRDGMYGFKFFCLHHYGMIGEPQPLTKVIRKPSHKTPREVGRSPDKKPLPGVAGLDLLDRVQTPERIEFSNLSTGNISSDQEESLSQMDEDEWTDKNFGASCAENDSEDESSSLSDTDSDDEDAYDDALEEPVTKEGTMKWAERWKQSYSRKRHDSDSNGYSSSDQSSYYENSSDDDESDTATEGEEEIRARELRKQEVRVEPPVVQTDTGTDTEVVSDETTESSSSEIQNSATEISTDSEFAHDDPTPTREIPSIVLNDFHVTKTRGSGGGGGPKRIQVTTGYLQRPSNGKPKRPSNIELKLKPLVPSAPAIKKPAPVLLPHADGYALNRTQSTGGIAAKVSLELKKKYLLGEAAAGSIQKSGSASTLDSKFKTFHTTISDCQKLLKPAPEVSASMQTFCNKLDERHSPAVSPQSSIIFPKDNAEEKELPPPDVTNVTPSVGDRIVPEDEPPYVFQNESEGRPRSPVHETSIIVPNIDWSKKNRSQSSDSLCTSSDDQVVTTPNFQYENIPRVEIHTAKDDDDNIPPDSLCVEAEARAQPMDNSTSEIAKSITSEKKSLNQPKSLPNLENMLPEIHRALHVSIGKIDKPSDVDAKSALSGLSSPDSGAEQATAALTETELSDWARDGAVSDDFEDVEFEFDKPKSATHVCSKEKQAKDLKNKTIITEAMNNVLSANLDHIEFMDTGTETSSDDGIADSQNGYVLFKNEDDFAEDSLNPNINEVVEARNPHVDERKNTGYCILAGENKCFASAVEEIKPSDLEKLRQKQHLAEHDEDSLLIVEAGTTTEENTCSDSTVKNVTEIVVDKQDSKTPTGEESKKQRLEEKLAEVKAEAASKEPSHEQILVDSNIEFEEHCQRLQSKVEFGNVKDSIDVRKSRRKSKSDASPQKPDLIQEELSPKGKGVTLTLTTPKTPDLLYKKEILKKERDVNQKLVQEMVMNKMKAENKTLERRRRGKPTYDLNKSATTTDVISQTNLDNSNRSSTYSTGSSTYTTPDVLLSTKMAPLQTSLSVNALPEFDSSSNEVFATPLKEQNKSTPKPEAETFAAPDAVTPKAPPRQHRINDETKTAEKLKQDARARARLMSNEELGLSPEEKLRLLREKVGRRGKENDNSHPLVQDSIESLVMNTERRNSWLYSNDTLSKKKNGSFKRSKSGDSGAKLAPYEGATPMRSTKSISELPKNFSAPKSKEEAKKMCKSDPNLLEAVEYSKPKKKSKEQRERRRSISKIISTLFTKRSPGGGAKGLFSKLSPKSKDVSKEVVVEETKRRKSLSEVIGQRSFAAATPPPVPPLPLDYTVKGTDESSEGEHECKKQDRSSCDTLDQSGILENSTSSLTGRRSSKSARKVARQAQLKRHRMAQEIQRKLEETEVKTRELETRGVLVEKTLRGEDGKESCKDESELLQEWFDLMRDMTELRRYEKELMVRAQELELEDRHARLQHELRERLENNEAKTEENLKVEESIINEMMEIVAKRDSIIAAIEEDRLRYSNEDRDLEEQMLAKGLRLTPIRTPEK